MKKNILLKFLLSVFVVVSLTGCFNKSSDNNTNGSTGSKASKSKKKEMMVSEVTVEDYGQYVDLGTNIARLDNGRLTDGTYPKSDWRVFYKDSNGIWLIISRYEDMDISTKISEIGLRTGYSGYTVSLYYKTKDREYFMNGLKGTIPGKEDWSIFLKGSSVEGKTGVKIQGSVDLETWVASWNQLNTPKLYINSNKNGYYIGDKEGTTLDSYKVSRENNALFFPDLLDYIRGESVDGYRLASKSAANTEDTIVVSWDGNITHASYYADGYSIRPVVYLPSDIKLDTSGEVWKIAE